MTMDALASPHPQTPIDYSAFLRQQLATQPRSVMGHLLGNEQIWVKRAGPPHGMGRYRAMAVLATVLRLEMLRPVPNPGGPAAIATEVRRLHELSARGVRVPVVLAVEANGFAMRHLGRLGEEAHSLGNAMERAMRADDHAAVLSLWQQGLDALTHVHRLGTCLSQAFARNMVRDPSGAVVCIDFEDDPAAVLSLPLCHVRDALCYAHSTAIYLRQSGMLPEARERWATWVAQGSAEMQALLATSIHRIRWIRHLPSARTLGRDLQRLRAAYDLLEPKRG